MSRPKNKNAKEICVSYLVGKTAAKVGAEFGLCRIQIYNILEENGIKRRQQKPTQHIKNNPHKKTKIPDAEKWSAMMDNGVSASEIAKRFGKTKNQVIGAIWRYRKNV